MCRIKIGYVSKKDPFHDKLAWSGSFFKIRAAIETAGFEVRWIPYGSRISSKLLDGLFKVRNQTFARKSKWLLSAHLCSIAKIWAKEVDENPNVDECDYLFFPGDAQVYLYTKKVKPLIYFTDATAQLMLDYYWFDINEKSRKMASELETAAAQIALVNIRSSQWAIDSVINDCHCDINKCFVLPFGPNVDYKDIRKSKLYEGGELTVLFSGVDWRRKGGDIAVEVVGILRNRGIDARLIVAGPRSIPNSCVGKGYVDYVGFLNKNNTKDYQQYLSLFEKSHVFLLPTIAECSATVYSEAAAAGLPCYTYLTGGTGDYVMNGVNGYALPMGSSPEVFADQIINDIKAGRLSSLREGAFKLSKEKLNWDAWSKGFAKIIETIID